MIPRLALVVPVLLASVPAPATPQAVVTPDDRTGLAVTVYDGFAQVHDSRRVATAAPGTIVWPGVPAGLDPGTLLLLSGGRIVPVASQAVEADVADPASLLARAVGLPVTLVAPDGARTPATVVSPEGPVYRVDGRLLVGWQGAVELPEPAGGVLGEPVVRWRLEAPLPAPVVTAAYLTDGLAWSTDYVALLGEDEERLALSARVTIENRSRTAYPDATLRLVAGTVRRGGLPRPVPLGAAAAEARLSDPSFARTEGERHVYTLDRPATLGREETTQIELLASPAVAVDTEYVLPALPGWVRTDHPEAGPLQHAQLWLSFDNDDANGLGEPLPAGVVHVYRADADGLPLFAGDSPVGHTPAGERVRLAIGEVFDTVAERVRTAFRRIDERTAEVEARIEVRNHGSRPRVVHVYEDFHGDWTILEESRPHERVDADTARWTVRLPAGGAATISYRARIAT